MGNLYHDGCFTCGACSEYRVPSLLLEQGPMANSSGLTFFQCKGEKKGGGY